MEALTGSSNSKRRSAEDAPGDTLLPLKRHQRENDSPLALGEELLACLHDVSHPEGYVAPPPRPLSSSAPAPPPAKVFEFTLDPFQSEAIKCLESGESVMV
jgi:ATP-dependent RNA helicase DOB1